MSQLMERRTLVPARPAGSPLGPQSIGDARSGRTLGEGSMELRMFLGE